MSAAIAGSVHSHISDYDFLKNTSASTDVSLADVALDVPAGPRLMAAAPVAKNQIPVQPGPPAPSGTALSNNFLRLVNVITAYDDKKKGRDNEPALRVMNDKMRKGFIAMQDLQNAGSVAVAGQMITSEQLALPVSAFSPG